ncbi:uncharacterized protein LOC111918319 isoform X2 [Lactuca sativa]|uniref:uncharacterized protein LOC111918319 isoform X2 n=1 Tax=Lactuca sativa TaxID=4236 RepID=UPI000CD8313C|nr:uncharacterized protein LOC111918319 isoform X2 [Lactuca sativa]
MGWLVSLNSKPSVCCYAMGVLGVAGRRFNRFSLTKYANHRRHSCEYIQKRKLSSNFSKNDSILPVLIIGAGPVGLVLSVLLTKLGVKCAVLERSMTFSKHPQAHFINNRSMEIFRRLDGLAEEIQRCQPPVELWRKFIYCTSLTGSTIGSVDHMQTQDFDQSVSPVSVAHFSQYKLNALLLKQLETNGFSICTHGSLDDRPLREREILMGHNCVSIDATDDFINVTTSFLKEGKQTEKQIPCQFLIGADGAGSTVRNLVGIELRGEKDMQKLVSVHFVSQELGHYLMYEKPGMLFFIFNPGAIGVLVAHDLKQGEFVLQTPFYPPQQNFEDFTSETCKMLILKLVGREVEDINVVDIKPWVMHAEVADKYLACGNRIILAGDAAHRFPPAGGFGNNKSKHFRFHESHLQSRSLQLVVTVAHIIAVAHLHRTTKSLCTSSHPILESSLKHRFKNWQDQRMCKLTASTFAQAIGFWPNRRVQLWLEKIGVVEPFTGNLSTCWNNIKEEEALRRYIRITGNSVIFPDFHVSRNLNSGENQNQNRNWLAASPDGVIDKKVYGLPYRGVLEIKCPFYKGDMRKGYPWTQVPYNFIPQAQGLMGVLDCDWMDFYVWTPKGSSLIRIYRDLDYWEVLKMALSDFWWGHVQPAREIYNNCYVVRDPLIELKRLCPEPKHELCSYIVEESKRVVGNSRLLMREINGKWID